MRISSPSKVFEGFGININEGLQEGIEESSDKPTKEASMMANQLTKPFDSMSAMNITPSNKQGNTININIDGLTVLDDYGVDKFMDRVVERLEIKGGIA